MKISTNSRYALRFLARVAQKNEERVTVASVAQTEGISEKLLERIAAKLASAGFVESTRGAKGGYRLSRAAESITVSEILKTMERPYLPHHCMESPEKCCKMYKNCSMLRLWRQIDEAVCSVTDNISVADIIRDDLF